MGGFKIKSATAPELWFSRRITLFSKAEDKSSRLLALAWARDSKPCASPCAWFICSCWSPSVAMNYNVSIKSPTLPMWSNCRHVPEARILERFFPSATLISASRMPSDSRMAARFLRSASTCICIASWTRVGNLISPASTIMNESGFQGTINGWQETHGFHISGKLSPMLQRPCWWLGLWIYWGSLSLGTRYPSGSFPVPTSSWSAQAVLLQTQGLQLHSWPCKDPKSAGTGHHQCSM